MINNYVIYDINGLLVDSLLTPVSKGNNKVDIYAIAFNEHDYNDTYVTVAGTLPNGNTLPELATSIQDFEFKNKDYRGYKFELVEALTSIAGTLTLTFNLKSKLDDTRLCSSVLKVTIHDTDVATDPTITEAQLDNLTTTIDTVTKDLENRKLNKNFNYYASVTEAQEGDKTILFTANGENKSILLNDMHNINNVNGVTPINKTITLTANDINHDDETVGSLLNEINNVLPEKANYDEVVAFRDGTVIDPEINVTPYKGLLPFEYVKTVSAEAQIASDGYSFKTGDIIDFDLTIEIGTVEGGSIEDTIHVTRLVNNEINQQISKVHTTILDDIMRVYGCRYTIEFGFRGITIKDAWINYRDILYQASVEITNIIIFRP